MSAGWGGWEGCGGGAGCLSASLKQGPRRESGAEKAEESSFPKYGLSLLRLQRMSPWLLQECVFSVRYFGRPGVLILRAFIMPPPLGRRKWVCVLTIHPCQSFVLAGCAAASRERYKITSVIHVRSSGLVFLI